MERLSCYLVFLAVPGRKASLQRVKIQTEVSNSEFWHQIMFGCLQPNDFSLGFFRNYSSSGVSKLRKDEKT